MPTRFGACAARYGLAHVRRFPFISEEPTPWIRFVPA
jgi:hypothetical protein